MGSRMKRRASLKLGLGWAAAMLAPAASAQAVAKDGGQAKVLRYALRVAETGFDPAQLSDLYSATIAASLFEAPLQVEFLARPVRYRTNTAAKLPDISADFTTYTFTIKPGIHFADDPAFNGRRRELVAADYVYSLKRHYDPRWKSPSLYFLENAKVIGLSELRREAIEQKKPFDYDRDVEGLRALDRYTFQVRLAQTYPRFEWLLTDASRFGAVAREVVERYGDKMMEHPVGTGPYRLAEWRRASKITLERNPNYREVFYDEEAPADDPRAQAAVKALQGKRLPLVDRVEVSIIEESQPRWLAFLNREHDLVEDVPQEFADMLMPNNELAPNLARQGIQLVRYLRADVHMTLFNMEDPTVGGTTPERVALRRAISLARDIPKEIRLVRKNQAIVAQGAISPNTFGYDPALRTEHALFDLPRAKALLDLHGYVDRDGDGWREQPDGSPLTLVLSTESDQWKRALSEAWQKDMAALGIRMDFRIAQWPENLKASRAGKLQMWLVGWSVSTPDGDGFLQLGYGPNKGQANHSRFDLPAFNALYEKQKRLPDGPERLAAMTEAQRLMVTYAPYKIHVHRTFSDMAHPWVIGYHRNVFVREFWKYVDIDPAKQPDPR
ncbi:MAG TPA: ABC transporter substrate-binding protein [Methylibium sp.]|uniref:ABC transporter substrate-binding protein n=1 Tax=Methylibium sp. TaxID=2067992 RepID=UPI002DBC8C08|nr:ABC transporter substrate-binding protein [Methylibium sp.]HEU4458629.1 ABC transporter substrate-binding protein [Methylibium sp.]